ncbi:phenylalanine--tRNA ligase subunit beta [Amnibacterium kyonggiense]|uniref:Phenylalanine--tRNA ligase beta subunit n=1 Tax=Amnibacterium kyonggiense TaxID=595671 RepID=A0A4R7FHF4_9MICO|nr:phenylalanine--tRNA ligase subunit beta [Amnibacterium kyonggiense]TDS75574.1 phenylalanyl-tRNA synthetase beta subunit [Amnibacterium kyonggiense]
MRIPVGWLAEYADLPAGTTPEALHAALVRVGFEEETVHGGDLSGPVVVGEVLEFTPEPQKNGKTIRWCSVRVAPEGERAADGGEAVRGIVCGAGNFLVGDKVVVTLPGTVLPGPFPIAARRTYGHVSDGMIASSRELGLSDEHDGILRLTEIGLDPEVGTDAIALLGLDDAAVEINVTPDRGYALSIRGVAREYGASTGAAFRDPALAVSPPDTDDGAVRVAVDDGAPIRGRAGCSVFVTRVVRGIDPAAPVPRWMSSRLRLAGVRSISLAVDVTNYVMLELGQPLHGYDLARIGGGALGVRRAKPGEPLVTLDGQRRALDAEDLVITDGTGAAIGLAGVMGGEATEIGASTTDVVIEAANFDPVSIGRTARRHKLPSEASRRFERGVDPAVARAAAQRAVDLLVELGGGTADPGQTWFDAAERPAAVLLPTDAVLRRTGARATDAEAVAALEAIGCTVESGEDGLLVVPPTWRRDLLEPVDLVEEVVRIVGYDRIPSVLPVAPPGRGLTREQRLRRSLGTVLAATGGSEVQSYPLVSAEQQAAYAPGPSMRVANPLDATAPLLRRSLLPGLLDAVRRNRARGLVDVALFELGSVFLPVEGASYGTAELPPVGARPAPELLTRITDDLPPQPVHVAVVVAGDRLPKGPGHAAEPVDWRDAVDAVRRIGAAVGVELRVRQEAVPAGFHPTRSGEVVTVGTPEQVVGVAGELLPGSVADVPGRVAAVEVDVDALLAAAPRGVEFAPISTMPAATQDVSLVVAETVPADGVRDAVVSGAGALLEAIDLVDDYRGAGLPDGAKSLTFALRFRAPDRTLTAAEATAAKHAGVEVAAERWGARLRE